LVRELELVRERYVLVVQEYLMPEINEH